MLKLVTWDLKDDYGYHAEILNGPFVKTAATYQGEYSPDIVKAIGSLDKKPGHTYLLINAMGAGEYYGPNKNSDYFPEKVLRDYHKTFEALAYVYKHHVNKDPLRSYGKVLYSFYNDKMHRVELIVEVANEKAPDIIEKISKGEHVSVSMGCKVPWDECNICGNRAKTREEYCSHLQRGVAGHIQSDGKRPYAINWQPKFFDISFVTIPADPTASVMAKVAALHGKPAPSHIINGIEAMDNLLKAAKVKHADIDKVIDGEVVAVSEDPKGLIPASQPEIPLEEIKTLTTENPLSKILSTLLALRIMPKMQDFQRLVLYSTGQGALSDECDRCKYLFPVSPDVTPIMPADVDLNYMDPMLARRMSHLMPQRSLSKPLVIIRIIEKIAETAPSQQPEMPMSSKIKRRVTKYLTPQQDQQRYSVETEVEALGQTPKLAGLFGNSTPVESAPTPPATVTRNPFFAITGLGALYIGFQRLMNLGSSKDLPKLERTMIQNPWLLPILAGAAGLTTVAMQPATPPMFAKTSELHRPMPKYRLGGIGTILAGAVPAYYYAGLQEAKVQRGEQIGQVQDWVRRHPFLTSLAGMATVRGGLAALNKHASVADVVTQLDEDTLNKLYFDLTS